MPERWYRPWCELIVKYAKERFGRELDLDYVMNQPMHLIWGTYMDARAFYKLERTYFSLDDVPDKFKDGNIVGIRGHGRLDQYVWSNSEGKWMSIGTVFDEFYKG
ncbi:hypothetical protein [Paenibacillus alkalitolerans]|uniref:hypothetical protein n=1 Tax=Paenibacillus alkalitolerans TaxID=2799335 RepID=UPI0018F447E7|nr:hypothetical protein [Paenibacillus alkalitolerans]